MEFRPMDKMARLSREAVVTEKLDGTNASVSVFPQPFGNIESMAEWDAAQKYAVAILDDVPTLVLAGSRTRWVTPGDDNFGWATWVKENATELAKLGPGHHFGEWWGKGIQRGYGLAERRFSLFNAGRWLDPHEEQKTRGIVPGMPEDMAPSCCHVVPVLVRGEFTTQLVDSVMYNLREFGSYAAKGFMDPEGVVIYHTAANRCFKKTIKGDAEGKSAEAHPKKERPAKPPRDPSKGGRRKGCEGYVGPKRRQSDGL